MKIKASAQLPEDGQEYHDLKRYIKVRYPGARVKEIAARPHQKVLYVTTKQEKPS